MKKTLREAQSLDELMNSSMKSFVISSDSSRIWYLGRKSQFSGLKPHTTEEIVAWLDSKNIPQLAAGNYWREFSDVAIHADFMPNFEGTETHFQVTVHYQKPKPFPR